MGGSFGPELFTDMKKSQKKEPHPEGWGVPPTIEGV